MASAPVSASAMTLAPEACACNRYELKSETPRGCATDPRTAPPDFTIASLASRCSALPNAYSKLMKYHEDPPILVMAPPTALPSAQVSSAHCTVVGWQNFPVRSDVAVADANIARLRSRINAFTARPTPELARSTIAETPSWSTQRRAIASPTSGLF